MAKLLPSAVVFLATLWFIHALCALDNNHRSNVEDLGFYFDDKETSLNKSTSSADPLYQKTNHSERYKEAKESHKIGDHKNLIKKSNGTESSPKNIANWDLKRLLQYVVSLLHSTNANESLTDEGKYERVSDSKNNKLETHQVNNTHIKYKYNNEDELSESYEASGSGKESEYYDHEDSNKPKESQMKIFKDWKTNISGKPEAGNQGRVSQIPTGNKGNNAKLTHIFEYDDVSRRIGSPRTKLVSDEFIDEYINHPAVNVPVKEEGSGIQMYTPLNKSASERNVSKIEDGMLINIQIPNSSKINSEISTTLSQRLSNDDFPRRELKNISNTTLISPSNETETKKNLSESSPAEIFPKHSLTSKNGSGFISETSEGNSANCTAKMTAFHQYAITQTIPSQWKQNSSIGESKSQNNSNSNRNKEANRYVLEVAETIDIYGKTRDNSSISNDSQKNPIFDEYGVSNLKPKVLSWKESNNTERLTPKNEFKFAKDVTLQTDFNSTSEGLGPLNDTTETEIFPTKSKNNTEVPAQQHLLTFIKHPMHIEIQNLTSLNTSEDLQTNDDSYIDSYSSEFKNSDELYKDYDYDKDDEDMSYFLDYLEEAVNNATTQLSKNSSLPYSNYSVEVERPTSFKNESESKGYLTPQKAFSSILEFLYRYSSNPLFQRLREKKNVTI